MHWFTQHDGCCGDGHRRDVGLGPGDLDMFKAFFKVLLLLLMVAVVVMTSCNSNEILLCLVCFDCGWLVCVLPQTFATLYPMKLYRVSRRRVMEVVVVMVVAVVVAVAAPVIMTLIPAASRH